MKTTTKSDLAKAVGDLIYPLRKGYSTPAPEEVACAVRTVIADWDGTNWLAVRHCIQTTMPIADDLDDWTLDDVRQRFAIAQRPMTIQLGGRINTTNASIIPISFATIAVETTDDSKTPAAEGGNGSVSKDRRTVNEKMMTAIDDDPRRISLTSDEWAKLLECHERQVRRAQTWKKIQERKEVEQRRLKARAGHR